MCWMDSPGLGIVNITRVLTEISSSTPSIGRVSLGVTVLSHLE